MKTNVIKILNYSLVRAVCAGALLLMASGASAQNMFVGTYGGHNIVEIPTSGPQTAFASGVNYPNAVAFDNSGNLFALDQVIGTLYEYTPGGARTTINNALSNPDALAFNHAGNLFVSSADNNNILEFANGGGTPTVFAGGLNLPLAIAFDSAGNLFVANGANEAVGSGFITKITPGGSESLYASGLTTPDGLAFDAAGDLYVANGTGGNSITEISPGGGGETTFASGLNAPVGLAFNSAGDLFVADTGIDHAVGDITEFAPNGTVINTITSVNKPLSIAFQGEALPVPEPSTFALIGIGAVAFLARRRR